jgi:hypothetical protein
MKFLADIQGVFVECIFPRGDKLKKNRQGSFCAYAADGVLRFGQLICLGKRSVSVLLKPTG